MIGGGENLRFLARDVVEAAKKRRRISNCLKKRGLASLGKGGWLGFRNKEIVSGLIIEGSALDTYVSTFILPAFDKHEFVNLALGNRIICCSSDTDAQEESERALDYYAANMSNINSSAELVRYIDRRSVTGHYPIWVRYISYLRTSDFASAIEYLDEDRRDQLHPVLMDRFNQINRFVFLNDRERVFQIFDSWSKFSERIFGPLDHYFDIINSGRNT